MSRRQVRDRQTAFKLVVIGKFSSQLCNQYRRISMLTSRLQLHHHPLEEDKKDGNLTNIYWIREQKDSQCNTAIGWGIKPYHLVYLILAL